MPPPAVCDPFLHWEPTQSSHPNHAHHDSVCQVFIHPTERRAKLSPILGAQSTSRSPGGKTSSTVPRRSELWDCAEPDESPVKSTRRSLPSCSENLQRRGMNRAVHKRKTQAVSSPPNSLCGSIVTLTTSDEENGTLQTPADWENMGVSAVPSDTAELQTRLVNPHDFYHSRCCAAGAAGICSQA